MKRCVLFVTLVLALAFLVSPAFPWSLEEAAKPYEGVTINCAFLARPGYYAAEKMIPDFEKRTGIKVTWETMPYENSREKQVLDFVGQSGQYDVALIDIVWVGEFAAAGWVVPLEKFYKNPELADPNLNIEGFFPLLLEGYGSWGGQAYGYPFDCYAHLLFYNQEMLIKSGFVDSAGKPVPPETWEDLLDVYGPKIMETYPGSYAFSLQSRRGETQSCDALLKFVWPMGGSVLDPNTCKPNLNSKENIEALKFQIALKKIMPPDVAEYDHDEGVQALAQEKVAMITEWSAFYSYFKDPKTSKIVDKIAVAMEPGFKKTGKRIPVFGGFSIGVNAFSSQKEQEAAYLFIQWLTSDAEAATYIRNGGVSGRMAVYQNPEIQKEYPHFQVLTESWKRANPIHRPRFPEYPAISEILATGGSQAFIGQMTPEEACNWMNEEVYKIMEKAGYYSGKKPCAQ